MFRNTNVTILQISKMNLHEGNRSGFKVLLVVSLFKFCRILWFYNLLE